MSSRIIESATELPYARFYVTCQDRFMSGWGRAEGKRNYCVFLCDTEEEATIVANNARARTDMVKVRTSSGLSGKPPVSRRSVWSLMDRDGCARWYEAGAFAADKAGRDGGK